MIGTDWHSVNGEEMTELCKCMSCCEDVSCFPTATCGLWAGSCGAQFLTQVSPTATCYSLCVCKTHHRMRP